MYSREAADWEGSGYGPLLMTPAVWGLALILPCTKPKNTLGGLRLRPAAHDACGAGLLASSYIKVLRYSAVTDTW